MIKIYNSYDEYDKDLDKMLDNGFETISNYYDNGKLVVEYENLGVDIID